ncbi:MAG: adenosylcobinamide-GDP ribazoletransferase [cyanobacterium endosymbiont of Rhopalodia musculus]|uniref:adenosylcobinamide-GDP ribazoletransferase n=1 Tax=cyanobacterium endosymbiont of Epithemia clementina EcSB TaxID=3034674 RepID=UPI0024815FD1|nr:adenosylcobinamide-GDP ribazoletransferase [cyanobacterium endosymbiont of Epithemia clementina EcSB]WGT67200.1 adenosylcobinamide-GDP ribazoletransferase [cyanobacterium endosymbiont of Epithemia clementina EcSB]
MVKKIVQHLKYDLKTFLGAITFYTIIPLPSQWPQLFQQLARWSPLLGILLGGGLGLADVGLNFLGFPIIIRSALIVAVWLVLTGGLHLDGVIDTADGLGATDSTRRLTIMQDSVAGAFGVMAAVVVLGLKTIALSEITSYRWLVLMIAAGWGRWGQVAAITFYPYLKPTGKGAFHKRSIQLPQDLFLGLGSLLTLSGLLILFNVHHWWLGVEVAVVGSSIAIITGFWFYQRLGGHTGDTYGAVVEWSEALILSILTRWFVT